ncbi:MAG: hypothetical protein K2O16_03225 [Lachnospiraceae bacterium]|nr:hypothetical protein [Lachnospiraceae bacterium]
MFITTAGFKSLIKEAYKNGRLVAGATPEEYLFEGSFWVIRVHRDRLPKKEKAAVVELTGELPSPGEVFQAAKGEANQQEMPDNSIWDIGNIFRNCREEIAVTRSLYQSGTGTYRVMQNRRNNNCFFISERFISIFDSRALTEGESLPEGPRALTAGRGTLYWKNNNMTLAVMPIFHESNDELGIHLRLLENMELPVQKLF